jgi:hypothetical protein
MATDRITGNTHERGETARLKHDIGKLRAEVNAYYQHFGPLPDEYSLPGRYRAYAPPIGYTKYVDQPVHGLLGESLSHAFADLWSTSNPSQTQQLPITELHEDVSIRRPNTVDGPHRGPIHETTVDLVDGEIDIGDFVCPDMTEAMRLSQATLPLNNSRHSSLTTILGTRKPERPQMPSREEALQYADNYLKVIAPYVPIVHGPTFLKLVGLWQCYKRMLALLTFRDLGCGLL